LTQKLPVLGSVRPANGDRESVKMTEADIPNVADARNEGIDLQAIGWFQLAPFQQSLALAVAAMAFQRMTTKGKAQYLLFSDRMLSKGCVFAQQSAEPFHLSACNDASGA
jgi:hypothetical protein